MRAKIKLTENGEVISIGENGDRQVIDNNANVEPLKIKDVIGRALPRIGAYKKLDNTKQVVALIDDVRIKLAVSYRK